jgi:intraflagellar transport protein 122
MFAGSWARRLTDGTVASVFACIVGVCIPILAHCKPFLCVQVLYEEPNVTSVAFNSEYDDLVAYTTHETLSVRVATDNPTRQRLSTLVIAFIGATTHCLAKQQLHQTEVSLVGAVEQLLSARKWPEAYQVASLGVTKDTWDAVGQAALLAIELDVARRAFVRTQNFAMLNLIHRLSIAKQSAVPEGVLIGQVLAHQV